MPLIKFPLCVVICLPLKAYIMAFFFSVLTVYEAFIVVVFVTEFFLIYMWLMTFSNSHSLLAN